MCEAGTEVHQAVRILLLVWTLRRAGAALAAVEAVDAEVRVEVVHQIPAIAHAERAGPFRRVGEVQALEIDRRIGQALRQQRACAVLSVGVSDAEIEHQIVDRFPIGFEFDTLRARFRHCLDNKGKARERENLQVLEVCVEGGEIQPKPAVKPLRLDADFDVV